MSSHNNAFDCSRNNWPSVLFVEHPELFLPILESMKHQAQSEVEGLHVILNEMKIPKDAKILDLSCGIGRHSINLVKKGYYVVGYDPSPFYIEKARRWANQELGRLQHRVRFYRGDACSTSKVLLENGETDFDVVISMFNSLGFFEENEDIELLQDIRNIASNNCILITETDNRDWRIRNFQPYITYEFDNLEIHEAWRFNLERSVAESRSRFYRKSLNGINLYLLLDLKVHLRLYSLHELKDIIISAGWNYIKSYGSLKTLEAPSYEVPNIITVSQNL